MQTLQPQLILFAQHGMTDTNQGIGLLAHGLAGPECHVVVPALGYVETLFQIEPLIQAVERAADQALRRYPDIPARVIATSLGGVLWVEVLARYPEWWSRIESLVLLGSPLGGAHFARMVDPFGWGIGIAQHLSQNRRQLAERLTAVIPTLVVAGNTTGGSDGAVTLESTKLKHAHFVCLDGVSHRQLKKHPAVTKAIQAFWSEARAPLPPPEANLMAALIEHFRGVPGMTDANERYFPKAKTVFVFSDGTSIRTWTNPVGVQHVFLANAAGRCAYTGFVGWRHRAGLQRAINRAPLVAT